MCIQEKEIIHKLINTNTEYNRTEQQRSIEDFFGNFFCLNTYRLYKKKFKYLNKIVLNNDKNKLEQIIKIIIENYQQVKENQSKTSQFKNDILNKIENILKL